MNNDMPKLPRRSMKNSSHKESSHNRPDQAMVIRLRQICSRFSLPRTNLLSYRSIQKSLLLPFAFVLAFATSAAAQEPAALAAARTKFAQSNTHSEADRQQYIETLRKLRDKYSGTGDWQAVDAEVRRNPAPPDPNFSQLRVGKWETPRHEYLYRKDGTWVMLPEEKDATNGKWRIEGNHYIATNVAGTFTYTIILLNKKYFIYADDDLVYYETRMH